MSFPPYPKYKDSGVEWLGEVPEHWDILRGRRLFVQRRDPARPGDNQLSATQKYGVIPQQLFMEREDQKVTLALSGIDNFKRVQQNDFVISLRSFQGGIEHSSYAGCVSPAYTILRAREPINSRYWAYALKSFGYISELQSVTNGIRDGKNISYEQFSDIALPFIPTREQQLIASFLDRETAKIDALIAEQQRLTELLKEKRQAVISHAVTKGLNPDAPMKPSGIEWLGDVPAHWIIGPLKRIIENVESGTSVNATGEPANESQLGVLKTSCVYSGRFEVGENKTVIADEVGRVSCPLRSGTLIVSRMNTPELIGAAGYVEFAPTNLYLPDRLWQVFVRDADAYFVYYWTRSCAYRGQVEASCTGTSSSMKNLGQGDFAGFVIGTPPNDEQRSVVSYLDNATRTFDGLVAEAERAIALLQERRTALISAAVTGKIDVRNYASAEAA